MSLNLPDKNYFQLEIVMRCINYYAKTCLNLVS